MMKVFAFAVGLAMLAGAAWADPVEGVWQTKKDDNGNFGYVQIKPCGPAFWRCGSSAFSPESVDCPKKDLHRTQVSEII